MGSPGYWNMPSALASRGTELEVALFLYPLHVFCSPPGQFHPSNGLTTPDVLMATDQCRDNDDDDSQHLLSTARHRADFLYVSLSYNPLNL